MGTANLDHQQYSRLSRLAERFHQVRLKTEELCRPLSMEDYGISVTQDTSPPKWHLAHTSWFYERFILQQFRPKHETFHPEFDYLFNSYYRRLGPFLPKDQRSFLSRPTLEEIIQYRKFVTEEVLDFLNQLPSATEAEVLKVLEIGINHEQQHQELLLMDIKRNFFANPLRPHYATQVYQHGEIGPRGWKDFKGGLTRIGVSRSNADFAFDNERDLHQAFLEPYTLATHLVSNDEYLAFMDDGGYDNPGLWLSDGWDVKTKEGWQHPLYWEKSGQDWWVMSLSGMVPLELSAPVAHVSFYEAMAFARWKGARLPGEGEWEHAARTEKVRGAFLENSALDAEAPGDDFDEFSQIHGTLWEWTCSNYQAYPRYQPLSGKMGEYNEKFMCNQMVMRGGACITPAAHYRITYRNFYYPHMRWMYGGIRLAKDLL